jgi:serine/threonine protein phosphatase 1
MLSESPGSAANSYAKRRRVSSNGFRHLILTDVHGHLSALEKALGHVNFDENSDVLICLGDTIDRGSHTRECMERFASLREHGHSVVMLAGNHDALLIEALQSNVSSLDMWLAEGFGSGATLSSYGFDPTSVMLH